MPNPAPTRRQLLNRIGVSAGSAVLYQAMTTLGHAASTDFDGPPKLSPAPHGASVIILGAGLAGMVAALELRRAGYTVRILEYQNRAGGRNWSLYGGDRYTELGGATQNVSFAPGNYLNPGPWRIPYHHRAILHYCRELGVALEPFQQVNHNAWLHSTTAFDGKPQRYRDINADFQGHTAELLAKAINQKSLDQVVGPDEHAALLDALRTWGTLDANDRYVAGITSSKHRGWSKEPGGGPDGAPIPSAPLDRTTVMNSGFWKSVAFNMRYEFQTTMFQPVGGMGQIGQAFKRQVGDLITYNARVTTIRQDPSGATVTYTDTNTGQSAQARADWCLCTLPMPILAELDIDVSPGMQAAIEAVPYASSVKVGLEFNRRFWEEDEAIYGGISYTDQTIEQISYPSHGYQSRGPAVLLGAYNFDLPAYGFAAMSPQARIDMALEQGARIHAQYRKEFRSGVAVAWSRVPWTLGCCGMWSEETRKTHYKTLTTMDRRIALAGEHASYVGCWQEGALLSSLDAVNQLHKRASST
jgi:monoamine oxidase